MTAVPGELASSSGSRRLPSRSCGKFDVNREKRSDPTSGPDLFCLSPSPCPNIIRQTRVEQALHIPGAVGGGQKDLGIDKCARADLVPLLGHTLAALERPEEAAAACREAIDTLRAANMDHQAMASLAGLACLSLAEGEPEQALRHVEQILDYLDAEGALTSEADPLRVYLTCYQVLAAVGDGRALHTLQAAHGELQQRPTKISDEELRRSFLENVPTNQEFLR